MVRRTAILTLVLVLVLTGAAWWALQWHPLLVYLMVINAVAAAYVVVDKLIAGSGAWRIPERILLGTALAGGSPAAWVAMQVMRHKTSKESFRASFLIVVVIQALLIGAFLYWLVTR